MRYLRFREKYPGEWCVTVDDIGWSMEAKSVLEAMEDHLGGCLGAVIGVFELNPYDSLAFPSVFFNVNERVGEGADVIRLLPENASWADMLATLSDFVALSFWWQAHALEALAVGEVADAVKFFGFSVANLARFETSLNFLESSVDGERKGLIDPAVVGKKGAEARHAGTRELMKFAIEKYSGGSWASMRNAAQKILPDVVKRGKEIGVALSEDNAHRTVYEWIRKAPRIATVGS